MRKDMFTNYSLLMEECSKGYPEKFIHVYDHYFKKIYDFAYYRTCNRESAEDITSQTFMRALEKADTYDKSRANVSTWLFKIASNLISDHFRAKRKSSSLEVIEELAAKDDFENEVSEKEILSQVMAVLKKLPEKKREIIILRIWQNMSYKEIAEISGASEASCKMIFYRAIDEIREKIPLDSAVILMLLFAACGMEV
ncbi:MAG TPA: sigma-70 family RNA polymerase sigma factor [Spirochaetota bacterium]|nr:sigma-70 family RNA polymerase sigma factor [Spirochaetota bacterium]HPK56240.1 sigma-70 family RNA polymerase sigma factor [Spirochaetota bacterium]HQE59632.1 sigma-70 family RNA polymerase sigma factor [Spirochaetota bacterium]